MTPTLATDAPSYARIRMEVGSSKALPGWVVTMLDALIGSGVVDAEALDGLGRDELCEVARSAMRRIFES